MLKRHLLLLAALTLLIPACARNPEPDMRYADIRPLEFGGELIMPGGEVLEDRYFQTFFKNADYVLLGESHTNMTDHMSQAAILEKMAKYRLKPVLGMEFVNVDQQHVLDRFNRGELSVDELAEALNWDRGVGFSFELYRPIFEVAARHAIPVYALNIPRQAVREARLNGLDKVEAQNKKYLPDHFIPASPAQSEHLRKFFAQHIDGASGAGAMPPGSDGETSPKPVMPRTAQNAPDDPAKAAERAKSIEGFITAQAVWDSVMAEHAVRAHRANKRPVVIIAGQGHVEYGWGIAMRLAAYDEGSKIVKVLPWREPLEGVLMQIHQTPLLDSELPQVFPTPDLADIYYYSPLMPVGKIPQGLIAGQNPASKQPQLMVLSVIPESVAEKAGFLAGDIILSVDRRKVESGSDFYSILAQAAAYQRGAAVVTLRGQEKMNMTMPAW